MDDKEIFLEDWKMTKSRIQHFDDVVMRTRLQGIPIATALQGVAFITSDSIGKMNIPIFDQTWPVFSLIILAGMLYLIPVLFLDIFHFLLLLKAVKYAKKIEKEKFENKLNITHAITSNWLTVLHLLAYGIYFAILAIGYIFLKEAQNILAGLE